MNMPRFLNRPAESVLTDQASQAEARLIAIKKSAKAVRKSVEESIRTSSSRSSKSDHVSERMRRTSEFIHGQDISAAGQDLAKTTMLSGTRASPLEEILDLYGRLEKDVGYYKAQNQVEIDNFISSDTPIAKLLSTDYPAVMVAKKDLEQLSKKHLQREKIWTSEKAKLAKMQTEEGIDEQTLELHRIKEDKLAHEVENLSKDVNLEQDKLTTALLSLVAKESNYAGSVLELVKLKKQFYENALSRINDEIPNMEKILRETQRRPVFGERLQDHLRATGRTIAYPINLAVYNLSNCVDEGLFRICPKQIKLDKLKAHINSGTPFDDVLSEPDPHLYSALLKSYLRDLPEPLLGGAHVYHAWIQASQLPLEEKLEDIRKILTEELDPMAVLNIQYLLKFLLTLSGSSESTKMNPHNIAIVLGPNLLWSMQADALSEHENLESVIDIVTTLVQRYDDIFEDDIDIAVFDDVAEVVSRAKSEMQHIDSPSFQITKPEGGRQERLHSDGAAGSFGFGSHILSNGTKDRRYSFRLPKLGKSGKT